MFALGGQRIETDQDIVDESGMAHHEAAIRQQIEELRHQGTEVGCPRKIIGAGEGGVECETCARGALAELRAQDIEQQRLGRAEPFCQRLLAASCKAATSSRPIAGVTTITEVALRRPRSIRSRMARLTPGLIP